MQDRALARSTAPSERYGWPLHVIDHCRDDPAVEQPQAFLHSLRIAIGSDHITEEKLA
jgi:hypothetical protein